MSGEDKKELKSWERSSLEIKIIQSFEAEIIGEDGEDYLVGFPDYDGEIVEAEISKKEFEGFPYRIKSGTRFGIVVYMENKGVRAEAWPVSEYWNGELRGAV